jgi:hypothetical protein
VPRQNNFCDCGVFVCRYAYALYKLSKHTTLKVRDAHGEGSPFRKLITGAKEFKFNMNEIQLMRKQLMSLIERLHAIHQQFLKEKAGLEAAEVEEETKACVQLSPGRCRDEDERPESEKDCTFVTSTCTKMKSFFVVSPLICYQLTC